jgi:hypothetical protein
MTNDEWGGVSVLVGSALLFMGAVLARFKDSEKLTVMFSGRFRKTEIVVEVASGELLEEMRNGFVFWKPVEIRGQRRFSVVAPRRG